MSEEGLGDRQIPSRCVDSKVDIFLCFMGAGALIGCLRGKRPCAGDINGSSPIFSARCSPDHLPSPRGYPTKGGGRCTPHSPVPSPRQYDIRGRRVYATPLLRYPMQYDDPLVLLNHDDLGRMQYRSEPKRHTDPLLTIQVLSHQRGFTLHLPPESSDMP